MPCRATDSTGIKVGGEGEWHARKHGGPKRRVWRKNHLGIDEQTLEIRAVEITGNHIGDAPVLPDLLSQNPSDEEIGSVTALSRQIAPQSPAGQWTALTTRVIATMPSLIGVLRLSSHPAGMRSHGNLLRRAPSRATRPCEHQK